MSTRGPGAEHDRRRQDILEAVFAIADTDGTDQVSIRNVADRAGVSAGRVQHYFPSKDDLLSAAFAAINERGAARVRERLAGGSEVLVVLAEALIPRTEEELRLFRIAQAFEAYALSRPLLRKEVKRGYAELMRLFGQVVPGGRGEEVLGLALGVAGLVVSGNLSAKKAREVVVGRVREVSERKA